ncbi:MAG TPA: hypothetical protein DHS57_07725 [Erysipelotrichaceae bacterium]|nr:hypothetical protein [Erysipelotrichaceae bacterium]
MNEIVYLIDQAERYFEEKHYEIGTQYYMDAWLTLKEYLIDEQIFKVDEIEFTNVQDREFIKKWIHEFHIYANEEFQFKTNIFIISSMIEFFDFTNEELIIKQRALCDSYYYLKEYETSDKLYENLLKKHPTIMEYYYGLALTLYDREDYIKAINILGEGIENSIDKQDQFVLSGFEVLLQIYDLLDEPENAEKTKEKMNKYKALS